LFLHILKYFVKSVKESSASLLCRYIINCNILEYVKEDNSTTHNDWYNLYTLISQSYICSHTVYNKSVG